MAEKKVLVPSYGVDCPQILRVAHAPIHRALGVAQEAAIASQASAEAVPSVTGAAYSNGTLTNGYGRASVVGVTAQIGAHAYLNVDMHINAISIESFTKWYAQAKQTYTSFDWHHLDDHYDMSSQAASIFTSLFGAVFASGQSDHYKNTADAFHAGSSQQANGLAQSVFNLQNENLHVTGTLIVDGVSFVPVTVQTYVQLTKIVFADSKTLYAIDAKNPVAATDSGDTSGVTTKPGMLNVVPAPTS